MCTPRQFDREHFRILLYRNEAAELLLETTGGLHLPVVPITRHTRVAQEITAAIRNLWNLETCCLFPLPVDTPLCDSHRCHVIELCQQHAIAIGPMRWFPVASLSGDEFQNVRDFATIQNALTTLERYRRGELPGCFGRPGWLQTVTHWVEAQAATIGLCLTGQFRQRNASPTFSLLRIETNGPALWFKAVGEPNLREYPITLALAKSFPAFVPRIIAHRKDWNAWLAAEADGIHPDAKSDFGVWSKIARTLADLQIASLGQSLHFINTGCMDARVCSLADQVGPFLEVVAELMEQQTKKSPASLSREELKTLGAQLRGALSIFDDSGIPNALGHLDFNPGNIVVSKDRCLFLDWAEACVGHPFLTFQYLMEHWRRSRGTDAQTESALLSAYTTPWHFFLSPREIATDLQVSPLLATFAYAFAGLASRRPDSLHQTQSPGYLRSLVRRMKREADALQERRLTCTR